MLSLSVFLPAAQAQFNNEVLEKKLKTDLEYNQDIRLGVDVLGFSKNNEYFNDIADGYTLFGYHLNPKLVYFPSGNIRMEAGVFLWKDFGTTNYNRIQPTFTIKLQKENYQFLFGNLQGTVNHRYIEPLYDFEKALNDPLENGLQFIWHRDKLWLDAWLDWQKMIYRSDPFQEIIEGGLSMDKRLLENDKGWRVSLPVQFTAQHKGGQIDRSSVPLLTVFNGATGFKLEKKLNGKFWKALRTENYYLVFKDFSNTKLLPYTSGSGIYLNAGVDTKVQNIILSYWKGQGFITEQGGRLFQSASSTVKKPNYLEKKRELLILRFTHDIKLVDDLYMTLRFEPLYDFNNPQLEFSNSIYLHFNTDFFLGKAKKNAED